MLVFGGYPETEDLHFGSFWHLKVEITLTCNIEMMLIEIPILGQDPWPALVRAGAPRCLGLKIQIANCNTLVCQISSLKFTTRHFIPLHHVSSNLISPYLTPSHLISFHLASPRLISSPPVDLISSPPL